MRARISRGMLLLLLAPLASCGGDSPRGANVLLITLDTTRADHLGVYGHPGGRTPVLDRLAREGALFQFAIADVPVTLPSHTTIMTGLPALGHGVRYNVGYRVADETATLAEALRRRGYGTAAIISSLVLDAQFGLDQGFDLYDDDLDPGYVMQDPTRFGAQTQWLPKGDRRADQAVEHALRWLREDAPTPFFLWLHIYDPHFPFDPPHPWGRTNKSLYASEIQFTDRQLKRVFDWFAESGAESKTVVFVTADHGEGLDQHREDGHGIFLYDEVICVPLVVRAPGRVPGATVLPQQVRTIDIAPTALELAGHSAKDFGMGGSLVPLLTGRGAAPDSLAYSESIKSKIYYAGSGLKSVRSVRGKYILAPRAEYYDLALDPGERSNALDEKPEVAAARADLERMVHDILGLGLTKAVSHDPDEQTLDALRSLGYVDGPGSEVRTGSFQEEMTPRGYDPKDIVDVSLAAREIQNGFYANAEKKLLRFFQTARSPEEDPRLARLWAAAHQDYAKIWMVREDYAEAAAEYERAMKVDPSYEMARWSRIYALNLAGDAQRSLREGTELLRRYPQAWRIHVHRALALALLGRSAEARTALETVVREAPADHATTRNARFYLRVFGTPQEKRALQSYLDSERRQTDRSEQAGAAEYD
jgi:arylsulfatase A-like enzyme